MHVISHWLRVVGWYTHVSSICCSIEKSSARNYKPQILFETATYISSPNNKEYKDFNGKGKVLLETNATSEGQDSKQIPRKKYLRHKVKPVYIQTFFAAKKTYSNTTWPSGSWSCQQKTPAFQVPLKTTSSSWQFWKPVGFMIGGRCWSIQEMDQSLLDEQFFTGVRWESIHPSQGKNLQNFRKKKTPFLLRWKFHSEVAGSNN